LQPDYPAALYLLAVALGASPSVRDVLERLVTIDPQNADAHYLLGQELLRVGRTQDAIAHWKTAVKLDPQNSSSLYKLARTLANVNDPQAKEYMDRYEALQSVRQMSDKVQTLNNSALQAADAHNWPQAVEQLQQAIQLCGQCKQLPVLHRNLGLIYARKGDIEHAKGELGLALKTDPPDAAAAEALNILNHLQAPVSGSN
jgi:tetratricopeptide (TPR) repeat protein